MTNTATPPPDPRSALFLDVDGTLIPFVSDPRDSAVGEEVPGLLVRLSAGLGGAVALVSGRPLAAIDRLFAPLVLPAAGLHGLERRSAAGLRSVPTSRVPDPARARLAAFVATRPGLLVEDKGATIAVHWRRAPTHADAVAAELATLARACGPGWHVQPGACVAELKPARVTKGTAVAAFLVEPPFAGRLPLYLGDDLTDLDGFAAAEAHGGAGVAIGPRVEARYRLPDPAAAVRWLSGLADALGAPRAAVR